MRLPAPPGLPRPLISSADVSTDLPADYFNRPLAEVDPDIAEVLARELDRQQRTLEMIASENFVRARCSGVPGLGADEQVRRGLSGTPLLRKGREFIDIAEQLAIDRAKELFGAEHANVQPHAGAQANAAAYHALMAPGDTLMGMELAHGGHLTHGMKINFSGRLYDIAAYQVDRETSLIDMDEVQRLAEERRPKVILAGWSAYPRVLDFKRFREIADSVDAYLVVDMAHFAGLVAAGLHPNPVPHAHVTTTTIHKTIGGGRGGLILCTEELAKKIDSAVFPGQQGVAPLEHIIAGKAVALRIAASELFRERQERTLAGAKALAEELLGAGHGVSVLDRRPPRAVRPARVHARRQAGRGPARRSGDYRQSQRGPVRPAAPRGLERAADRDTGSRDARAPDRGLHRGRAADRRGADRRGLRTGRGELAERAAQIADRYPLYATLGTRPRVRAAAQQGGRLAVDYVSLGGTGLRVSRICLGMMSFGPHESRQWALPEEANRSSGRLSRVA